MPFSQNDFLSFSTTYISAYVAYIYTKLSRYTFTSILKIFFFFSGDLLINHSWPDFCDILIMAKIDFKAIDSIF